ncbi:MAG: hypothetical protein ABI185_11525 [Ginsengibacter sp.]
MLVVRFKKIENHPKSKIEFYNSINRIPLSITIGDYLSLPNTIYCENALGQNFIELRFDKDRKNLYEISLVTIQNDTVINKSLNKKVQTDEFYICNIVEGESLLKDTLPIEIERDENSICINLLNNKSSNITYFHVSDNTFLGIDDDCYLISIFINKLSDENIKSIFGY